MAPRTPPSKNARGERLLVSRIRAGLGQAEVATILGVTSHTIGRWEKGGKGPTANHLAILCDLYQVSADYLLAREVGQTFLGLLDTDVEAEILETQDYRLARSLVPRLSVRITQGLVTVEDPRELSRRILKVQAKLEELRREAGIDNGLDLM